MTRPIIQLQFNQSSDKWRVNKTVAAVSRIANTCVEQAVIVIIIIVSVKCKQWLKSSANNKEILSEIKQIYFYLVCN